MNSALAQDIKSQAQASGHMDFPGFCLDVHQAGQSMAKVDCGKTYEFYDLASLTKIIFTTTYFMEAVSQRKVKLHQKLQALLPWYPHSQVRISDLLNHSAGHSWWQPFFKKINLGLDPHQRYQQIEKLCQRSKRSRRKKALYSDIDFFLLGSVMQKIEQQPLEQIWQALRKRHFSHTHLHFIPGKKPPFPSSQYAPTEKCTWRRRTLRAQVHDENAWALGGLAPHAGLFGRVEDLAQYGLWLRKQWLGEGELPAAVVRKFTRRSLPVERGDWGYGFMLPSRPKSSAGRLLSPQSFGHTGFTGISMWYDPVRDLLVSLVSNRVHPTRKNFGFIELRPKLHDWVVSYIEGRQ